jgi:hypothetical protein
MFPDRERDSIRDDADKEKKQLKDYGRGFIRDEALSGRAAALLRAMANQFLSPEEVERAVKDFRGAGYVEGGMLKAKEKAGICVYDAIKVEREALQEMGDSLLVHELGHYLQDWLLTQNLSSDPILKTVYDYLKQFGYDNETIIQTALYLVHDYDGWYKEACAHTLERKWIKERGGGIDKLSELYNKHHHAELLGELLKRSPEEFKKLMGNPSYATRSVGEKVLKSIGEQLGMEVENVPTFVIGRYRLRQFSEMGWG